MKPQDEQSNKGSTLNPSRSGKACAAIDEPWHTGQDRLTRTPHSLVSLEWQHELAHHAFAFARHRGPLLPPYARAARRFGSCRSSTSTEATAQSVLGGSMRR